MCTCTGRIPDSVVDRHRFDAEPDPDSDLDLDWH
jgi:hypothetical protein